MITSNLNEWSTILCHIVEERPLVTHLDPVTIELTLSETVSLFLRFSSTDLYNFCKVWLDPNKLEKYNKMPSSNEAISNSLETFEDS